MLLDAVRGEIADDEIPTSGPSVVSALATYAKRAPGAKPSRGDRRTSSPAPQAICFLLPLLEESWRTEGLQRCTHASRLEADKVEQHVSPFRKPIGLAIFAVSALA